MGEAKKDEGLLYLRPNFQVALIEIEKRCPLRCLGCYFFDREKGGVGMDFEKFKFVIDTLSKFVGKDFSRLELSGGEPFLHPELEKICEYCSEKLIKPVIFTSGYNVGYDKVRAIKSYISGIRVSIRYPNKLDDRFKGAEGAFKSALNLLATCKLFELKRYINWVVDMSNINFLDDMISLSRKYDAELIILPFFPYQEHFKVLALNKHMLINLLEKISKFKFIRFGISEVCGAGVTRITISTDGDVYPCPYVPVKCGNIFKQDFEQIILNLLNFRMKYKEGCIASKICFS